MRTVRKILLAGIAAIALVGSAGMALANGPALHTMKIHLPDGGIAQIQYSGNVPPKVTFDTEPFMADFYGPESPFATLDRISAQMNQEMSSLVRETDVMAAPLWNREPMFDIDLKNALPGVIQYSTVTTMSGDGHVCTRSIEMTSTGKDVRSRTVSHISGDCKPSGEATAAGIPFAALDHGQQPTVQIKARQSDLASAQSLQDAVFHSVR